MYDVDSNNAKGPAFSNAVKLKPALTQNSKTLLKTLEIFPSKPFLAQWLFCFLKF